MSDGEFGARRLRRRVERIRDRGKTPATAVEYEAMRSVQRAALAADLSDPPRDLQPLMEKLGVAFIRRVPLATAGRVVRTGGQTSIEINETLSTGDAPFVVAHELSHLILEQGSGIGRTAHEVESRFQYQELERLCDLGADELLLPAEWARAEFGESASLELGIKVARGLGLDPYRVIARPLEMAHWRGRLTHWRLRDGTLRAIRTAPPGPILEDMQVEDPVLLLEAATTGPDRIVRGTITLETPGGSISYQSECWARDHSKILSLFTF